MQLSLQTPTATADSVDAGVVEVGDAVEAAGAGDAQSNQVSVVSVMSDRGCHDNAEDRLDEDSSSNQIVRDDVTPSVTIEVKSSADATHGTPADFSPVQAIQVNHTHTHTHTRTVAYEHTHTHTHIHTHTRTETRFTHTARCCVQTLYLHVDFCPSHCMFLFDIPTPGRDHIFGV